MSAHQVHRMLGISYKSTWFMMHRLRDAMRSGDLAPMGGIFQILNELKSEQSALSYRVTGAASLASEVAKKVEQLGAR